jgi:hypothetical protein
MSLLRKRKGRKDGSVNPAHLPAVRQGVDLILPDSERFAARVTRVADDEVVLVVVEENLDPLQLGEVAELAMEFPGPRGLVRIEGHGKVDAFDVVSMKLAGAAEVVQRRDFVRVGVVRPMAVAAMDAEGRAYGWIDTLTVNISGNGILASGPDTLRIGTPVYFRVRVTPGEPPIEGNGHIARASEEGHRGIAFEHLSDDDRRRLVAFIFERQRIARRLTRDGEL